MQSKQVSLLVIIALTFASCSVSNKIAALKPVAGYSNTGIVYDKQVSFINLPVELSVADIQTQTNKYLPNGLIFEDNAMEGDNMMIKVWKQAPVTVSEAGGRLQLVLPLKIWAKVRYGFEKFGLSAYDTREVNLNGRIRLSAAAGLNAWKLNTTTRIDDVEWLESPTVSVAGKNIPITYLINPALTIFRGRLAKMVDEAIESASDIRPYVLDALQAMSSPVEMDAEYQTWLGIQPVEIYATRAVVANRKVTLNLGMKAYLETSVGSKPSVSFDRSKIQLKAVEKMPDEFSTNIAGYTTYQHAAALVQKNFAGQKFESGSRSVTVNKIDLWGKDNKIIVAATLSGSLNGDVYLSGIPLFDPVKKEIYLDQVDFVLDSKNKLLRAGDWLAHGLIVKKIAENCRYSIEGQLSEGSKALTAYLTNYQPVKGVKVNGKLTELAPNKVFVTPNAIVAMVSVKGKMAVSIDGME